MRPWVRVYYRVPLAAVDPSTTPESVLSGSLQLALSLPDEVIDLSGCRTQQNRGLVRAAARCGYECSIITITNFGICELCHVILSCYKLYINKSLLMSLKIDQVLNFIQRTRGRRITICEWICRHQ